MMEKLIAVLKEGSMSIPTIFFRYYKNIGLNDQEFLFLFYLYNHSFLFNPKQISADLHMNMGEVLEMVNTLTAKDVLSIEIQKNNNIREEYLSLEKLYHKLALYLIQGEEKEVPTNLFDTFEREFGRTLSPIEYELIHGWKDSFSEEMIVLALKEAIYNGVSNLRYIDKILYEWKKKGLQTKEDVERQREEYQKPKEAKEVFHYDWLNDHDE